MMQLLIETRRAGYRTMKQKLDVYCLLVLLVSRSGTVTTDQTNALTSMGLKG